MKPGSSVSSSLVFNAYPSRGCQKESFSKIATNSSGESYLLCSYSGIVWTFDLLRQRFLQVGKHQDALVDVTFCHGISSPNVVASCSFDGQVKFWDSRSSTGKEIASLQVAPSVTCVAFFENLFACGMEERGTVYLWDRRNFAEPLKLDEYHKEAVTQLLFLNEMRLISCGDDGYVCGVDLSVLPDEDEAIDMVINVGSALFRFGVYHAMNIYLWTLTHTQTLQTYDLDTVDLTYKTQREHTSNQGIPFPIDYLVSCFYDHYSDNFMVGGGRDDGTCFLFSPDAKTNHLTRVLSFENGHEDVVRDIQWNHTSQTITTVGEDGKLCIWKVVLQ
eukprot:jgi/Galph1/2195/GphlegSOOS_G911.1